MAKHAWNVPGRGKLKRALLLFLSVLILVLPVRADAEAVQAARSSVVRLYGIGVDKETGQRIRWAGTGFAVGTAGEETDVFLTNWHVVTGNGRCNQEDVTLWLLSEGAAFDDDQVPVSGCAAVCRVLSSTDGYPDVAVLQADVSGYPALPLLSSRQVINGSPVYALGFPGLDNLSSSGAEDVAVTQGTVSRHLTMTSAENTRSIIHSAALQHGFSGGPLINEDGAVVALNTYGFEAEVSTELFCAVDIDYAMELLDALGISYTRASGPDALTVLAANLLGRPELSSAAAYALALAGLLACAALIGCLIKSAARAFRRARTRGPEACLEEEQTEKEVQ